jgi:hypothetical protein
MSGKSGRTITNTVSFNNIEAGTATIGDLSVTGNTTTSVISSTTIPIYKFPSLQTLSAASSYTTNNFPMAALLPTTGGYIRTSSGAWTDVLPATASIITAVSAVMPNSVWSTYQYYDIYVENNTGATYIISQGDGDTLVSPGVSSAYTTTTMFTTTTRRAFFRIMRLSSTQIAFIPVSR